ncbi:MAG: hypothetical protein IKR23_03655 [Lachnospiraceae bacterium]|nr:hypothetical protein [Lachnospiraceae bacterium]
MRDERSEWTRTYDTLIRAMEKLGFKAELGDQIARQLGSPKAMERMIAYLEYVKPHSAEVVVDEMLAICSDIEAWKQKKACEGYNARYNELLYYGLDTGEE